MQFKLALASSLISAVLIGCGGDGNSAGSDNTTVVNKPPIAVADFFNVLEGNSLTLNVLANDIDPESGALNLVSAALLTPAQGTVTVSADKKQLNLIPNANFIGDIALSYVVTDTQGNRATGQATVTVKALQSLSSHQDSNCVVTSTGTVKCWGGNDFGQLGEGVALNASNRFKVTPVTVANVTGAKQVAMGYNHACAISQTGAVSCWGDNNNGQLGDGTQTARLQATSVVGLTTEVTQLALSYQSSCALLENGNIQCWGSNSQGELAIGATTVRSLSPQTVTLGANLKAKRLVAGKHHVCAISQNDSLFCWGANDAGQLGLNDQVTRYQPTQISLAGSVQQLDAGFAHTCVARANDVYCWGLNNKGQLGNDSTTDSAVPVVVSLTASVVDFALGKEHSCAVTSDNKTYCWGSRQAGQTAQTIDAATLDKKPILVASLTGKRRVSAGDFHSCSIEDNSIVKCWGKNDLGQLANGSSDSATPVTVSLN